MEIKILGSTTDLKHKGKDYYLVLKDIRGNFFMPIFGFFNIYKKTENNNYLLKSKEKAQGTHIRFNKVIEEILSITEKEKVQGRLLDLIKRLKNASNFDWTDIDKFLKFDKLYVKILDELKNLE